MQNQQAPTKSMKRRRASTSGSSSSSSSRVSFGSVQVREYARIAGNHPAAMEGPSLSLGWGFVEKDAQSVQTYEESRERASMLMPLSGDTRKFILSFVFDISPAAIKRSEKIATRIQSQREETRKLDRELRRKATVPKEKSALQKITAQSSSIQDSLPHNLKKSGYAKSLFEKAARKSTGAYKYFERLA